MIRAGAQMESVIEVDCAHDVTGNTGYAHNHVFQEFAIVAAGKAFWGLRARATIRTRVIGLHVSGAVNTCIQLEQGFINRVEDCDIQGCSIGIVASNEASSVVLANNNLEGQSFAGIVVGSGSNFLIQGAPSPKPFSGRFLSGQTPHGKDGPDTCFGGLGSSTSCSTRHTSRS